MPPLWAAGRVQTLGVGCMGRHPLCSLTHGHPASHLRIASGPLGGG